MPASTGVLRYSKSDAVLIALSIVQAGLLIAFPSGPLIAVGLWWNANTISHNFVHLPFFRSHALNRVYALYLTLLLAIPHSVWRERHLRHHRGQNGSSRWTLTKRETKNEARIEVVLIVGLWTAMASMGAEFFATTYLPGYVAGLGLCWVQGHFEHARGTTSHYGRLYNCLFLNDGYHVEHHLRSSEHWSLLPSHRQPDAAHSGWPPVLRWLDSVSLESFERLVVRSIWLQRFVIAAHERAFRALLPSEPEIRRITIVGGGLFPRTALVLRKIMPAVPLTIVDASAANLEIASRFLDRTIELCNCTYRPQTASRPGETDEGHLVVIPLAFIGDRERVYREPDAPFVLVHDWIWKRRARGVTVSWLLLKRLNLITR
jgi:fatty acid desaturase